MASQLSAMDALIAQLRLSPADEREFKARFTALEDARTGAEARAAELETRAKEADARAGAMEARAKEADSRAGAMEARAKEADSRADALEARAKEADSRVATLAEDVHVKNNAIDLLQTTVFRIRCAQSRVSRPCWKEFRRFRHLY